MCRLHRESRTRLLSQVRQARKPSSRNAAVLQPQGQPFEAAAPMPPLQMFPFQLTDAGHAAQVAVLEWLGLCRLQLPRLRIQHARQVLALLLRHLRKTCCCLSFVNNSKIATQSNRSRSSSNCGRQVLALLLRHLCRAGAAARVHVTQTQPDASTLPSLASWHCPASPKPFWPLLTWPCSSPVPAQAVGSYPCAHRSKDHPRIP